METKKYLSLPQKIAYGMDDSAWCFISLLVSSFMMIYLTDSVGLNPGIIGSLMLVARLFDGVSDVLFGRLLDKTKTKYGKARPWMFWSMLGCAVSMVALFGIPESLGDTAKYAWFFIFYMLVNTVFYTSGYIAYSTLMSLITRNREEQVQVTSYRTLAGNLSYMVLGSISFPLANFFGGGAQGWRMLAIVYAAIGIVINTIAVLVNHEIPDEELEAGAADNNKPVVKESSLKESIQPGLKCRYFYGTIVIMLLIYFFATVFQTSAAYYSIYVLGNENMMGTLSVLNYGVTMTAAFIVPFVIKKINVQKLSLIGCGIGIAGRIISIVSGTSSILPGIFLGFAVAAVGTAVIQTTVYTMMASTSEYLLLKDNVIVNGLVFSCSSMGIKLGSGIGTAVSGLLLSAGGYVSNAAVQSASTIAVLNFMFLWIPLIVTIGMFVIYMFMDVDKKIDQLRSAKAA